MTQRVWPLQYIHTHSFITFAEFRNGFFIAALSAQVEGLHWGAGAEIALQQPDALPTEPRRTQLRHVAQMCNDDRNTSLTLLQSLWCSSLSVCGWGGGGARAWAVKTNIA